MSEFSQKADFILGHNIVNHDLPIAKAAFPETAFLKLPVIDTLFLSPLAFPENPYHNLIKDYNDLNDWYEQILDFIYLPVSVTDIDTAIDLEV